ncbi:YdcF family protein [Candidatus Poribacteria bacterium]|nr:YdcF family protein [Candidatus Poribacteria bacterium]
MIPTKQSDQNEPAVTMAEKEEPPARTSFLHIREKLAGGTPIWQLIPDLVEHAYRNHLKITQTNFVVLYGLMPLRGELTPTCNARVARVCGAYLENEISPDNTWIIFTGYRHDGDQFSEAQLMQQEFLSCLKRFRLTWPPDRMELDNFATTTKENAKNTADIIKTICKKRGIIAPSLILPCTNNWHFFRQDLTSHAVPQRGEFRYYHKKWPGVRIEPLAAPDPNSVHIDEEVRWLNNVHISTHYGFTPIIVNLYYILDILEGRDRGTVAISDEALFMYEITYAELCTLEHYAPRRRRSHQVEETLNKLRKSLDDLKEALDDLDKIKNELHSVTPARINKILKKIRAALVENEEGRKGLRYISWPDRLA